MMQKEDCTVFDSEWMIYYETLEALESCFIDKSIFISESNVYQMLVLANPEASGSVYWFELLGRVYSASAAGIMRTLRWLKGVKLSISHGNFHSLAANLRGLLESAADQCYSLKSAPKFLAGNYDIIMEQLYCNSALGEIATCEELENLLIHFYHASRLPGRDPDDAFHNPLTSEEYLSCLQGAQSGCIFDLYALLCDISHPATGSLIPFVKESTEGGYLIILPDEGKAINDRCISNMEAIVRITAGINCCLLTLLVLNGYPVESLHTDKERIDLEPPGWSKLEGLIKKKLS